MACIHSVAFGLAIPCGTPKQGDLGSPVSAKVLNASDIASFTVSPAGEATITRKPKTVGYDVTTVNNSMVITVGLKSQDIMPGAFDVAITFRNFNSTNGITSSGAPFGVSGGLTAAKLVFAVDHGNGVYKVYGLGVPLVCTEVSGDSSASAFATYTFGVEDWQVGTTIHVLSKSSYDTLSKPAVAPQS